MHITRIATPILLTVAVAIALSGCASKPGTTPKAGSTPDFRVELNPATCQFTGGSDRLGNVEVKSGTGGKTIQVMLSTKKGYSIEPIVFKGRGAEQMKATGGGKSGVVNIFNRNSGPADVKYSVMVRDIATGKISDCDPRIINRPA